MTSAAAVSPATAAVAPATPIAAEPAAPAVVAAAVVPTVVAAPTKEAVVAGARPHPGSLLTAATVAATAADKVRDDAQGYAYRDHEQDDQKQFHGTILPVDVPGYKDSILPVCVRSLQHTVHPCARARVVY